MKKDEIKKIKYIIITLVLVFITLSFFKISNERGDTMNHWDDQAMKFWVEKSLGDSPDLASVESIQIHFYGGTLITFNNISPSDDPNSPKISSYTDLSKFPNLKEILIRGSYLTQKQMEEISHIASVEKLIFSLAEDTDYSSLLTMSDLKEIQINENGNGALETLPKTGVKIALNTPIENIGENSHLSEFQNITKINSYIFTDADWNILNQMKNLESLNIINDLQKIQKLGNLPNLKSLSFKSSDCQSLDFFKINPTIEELSISTNYLPTLDGIEYLTNLEALYCNGALLENIDALKKLSKIRKLQLRENIITDISALSEKESLIFLDLYENQIQDLSPLSTCLNIRYLEISTVIPLYSLKNLKLLYMFNTIKLSWEPIDALLGELPELELFIFEYQESTLEIKEICANIRRYYPDIETVFYDGYAVTQGTGKPYQWKKEPFNMEDWT